MAYQIQLDLFEQEDSFTILEKRVSLLDKKLGNVQRGIFARIGLHDEKFIMLMETLQRLQMDMDLVKRKLGFKPEVLDFTLKPESITNL